MPKKYNSKTIIKYELIFCANIDLKLTLHQRPKLLLINMFSHHRITDHRGRNANSIFNEVITSYRRNIVKWVLDQADQTK